MLTDAVPDWLPHHKLMQSRFAISLVGGQTSAFDQEASPVSVLWRQNLSGSAYGEQMMGVFAG